MNTAALPAASAELDLINNTHKFKKKKKRDTDGMDFCNYLIIAGTHIHLFFFPSCFSLHYTASL